MKPPPRNMTPVGDLKHPKSSFLFIDMPPVELHSSEAPALLRVLQLSDAHGAGRNHDETLAPFPSSPPVRPRGHP